MHWYYIHCLSLIIRVPSIDYYKQASLPLLLRVDYFTMLTVDLEALRLRDHRAFGIKFQGSAQERGMFLSDFRPKRLTLSLRSHEQLDASDEVDDEFPDALREPILRKVQFQQISRIDNLGKHYFLHRYEPDTNHVSLVDYTYEVRPRYVCSFPGGC